MIYFFSVEHIGENIPRGENKLIKTKSALDFVYTFKYDTGMVIMN